MYLDKYSIYARYRNRNKNLELGSPFLILRENGIDLRLLSNNLLPLTTIKEILITRVYISI